MCMKVMNTVHSLTVVFCRHDAPQKRRCPTGEVINLLLHHVGAMCIHQLNVLAASSSSLPVGAFLGKQHPIEAQHFSSICDIMEKAMVNGDTCIIRCILVVFQVRATGPGPGFLCLER